MPVPFDLTSTRALPRCIAGSTLSGKGWREREREENGMADGRLGGWWGGSLLGHLIGRQSFLIGSQEIYRNEPRWRIVMTWPRAREVDLERDMCECICGCVCIYAIEFMCVGTAESRYQMELLLTTVTKPGLRITCSIRKDDTLRNIYRSLLRRSKDCEVRDRLRRWIITARGVHSSGQSNLMYGDFLALHAAFYATTLNWSCLLSNNVENVLLLRILLQEALIMR